MLVIRDEQMAVFRNQLEGDFRRRLFERLKQVRDDGLPALTDDRLSEQMERGLRSGRRFFSTERDLARYLEIVLTRLGGWNGDDHPQPAIDLLASLAVPGQRRLDHLEIWLGKARGGR